LTVRPPPAEPHVDVRRDCIDRFRRRRFRVPSVFAQALEAI
jgi:hypothetical protein